MATTVSFTDNADGTVTATIAGGGGADSNAVYTASFTHDPLSGDLITAWTLRATIVGNTTASFALTAGHYFGYSVAAGVVATMSYFVATNGETAVHYQALLAVQVRIQALALTGISSSNIVIRHINTALEMTYPCIVLSPVGLESQPSNEGTNIRDDVSYPITCSILAADNQSLNSNQAQYLLWRQKINRALRHQRLTGASTVFEVEVQPAVIVSPNDFWKNVYHSGLVIRCKSREPRGS